MLLAIYVLIHYAQVVCLVVCVCVCVCVVLVDLTRALYF